MKAKMIYVKTRLYLGDMNETSYSDWEVFHGINDALRMVAEENAKVGGPLFRSKQTVTMSNNAGLLPEDFIKIIKCFDSTGAELLNIYDDVPLSGEFSISGTAISSATTPITMWYFSYPKDISGMDENIDIPESMLLPVAKIACECVKNENEMTLQIANLFYGTGKSEGTSK